ncbi:hypothetical protein GFL38_11290 [Rhizobium leguminosarum bv. viciae]|uniref:hypothetical protein n=1 Tax=Rhizobium ruizarguesonis TaxID=2081791 RepID=UPI00143F29D6|nr:hypothetical protein [Rhizobium ruizarguesonis]NKJ72837.1 hypothetical protein [Rhizobium leguminosarum bv. viciae]NKQ80518.1 hypothetical protein [Rhizobium ruizarguesonis]
MVIDNNISWAAIAAIAVFVLSKMYELIYGIIRFTREKRRFIQALYGEINFHLFLYSKTVSASGSEENVRRMCEKEDYEPYYAFNFQNSVFKSTQQLLSYISHLYIPELMKFYGYMEGITVQIDSTKNKSFTFLDVDQKMNVMRKLRKDLFELVATGHVLAEKMRKTHDSYHLRDIQ